MAWKNYKSSNSESEQDKEMQQAFDLLTEGVKSILPEWKEYLKFQAQFRNISFNNIAYLKEQIKLRQALGDPTDYRLMVKGEDQWAKEDIHILEEHKMNPLKIFAPNIKKFSSKERLNLDELVTGDNVSIQGTITKKMWGQGSNGLYTLQIERVNGIDKSGYINIIGEIADTVMLQRSYTITGDVGKYRNLKQIKVESINEIKLSSSYTKSVLVGYLLVDIYDIGQTDCKDIPSFCNRLQGTSDEASDILSILHKMIDIPIKEEVMNANGYFDPVNLVIATKIGISDNQKAKTTVHEFAHYFLHKKKESKLLDLKDYAIKNDKDGLYAIEEVLVESIAFIISHFCGLDTSEYSFGYVCSWSDGDISAIKKVGKLIQSYAKEILDTMDSIKEKMLNPVDEQVA